MTLFRHYLFAIVATSCIAFTGCGDSVPMAEVDGVVKMNGQTMDKIQVEFWPVTMGPRSVGVTDGSGRFSLMSDDGKRKGAVVGSHKVVLTDASVLGNQFLGRAGEDVDMSQGRKSRIAGDYADPQKSSITKEVVAGKKNEIELDVMPAAK